MRCNSIQISGPFPSNLPKRKAIAGVTGCLSRRMSNNVWRVMRGTPAISVLLFGDAEVVDALQLDPDIGTVPQQLAEAQGHRWRNRLSFTQNVEQRLAGNEGHACDFGVAFRRRRGRRCAATRSRYRDRSPATCRSARPSLA